MTRLAPLILCCLVLGACTGRQSGPAPAAAPTETRMHAPRLHVSPDPVVVDTTFVGCTRSVDVELRNAGSDGSLTVTRVTTGGPSLRIPGALGLTLGPGDARTLRARFTPSNPQRAEGAIDLTTEEDGVRSYRVAWSGEAVAAPKQPLDLVFVLDVSTTMDEIAALRGSIEALFDRIDAQALDVRVGLTTFENDIVVHRDGEFLDRASFFRELDSQLLEGTWIPNPELNRQLVNLELPENSLGALYRSVNGFEFRPAARRFLLLMTDATFLEPPAVFSDGTPAMHPYTDVEASLERVHVNLFSIHAPAYGSGLSEPHNGEPALVDASEGSWLDIDRADSRSLDAFLTGLLTRPDCR